MFAFKIIMQYNLFWKFYLISLYFLIPFRINRKGNYLTRSQIWSLESEQGTTALTQDTIRGNTKERERTDSSNSIYPFGGNVADLLSHIQRQKQDNSRADTGSKRTVRSINIPVYQKISSTVRKQAKDNVFSF